MDDHGIMTQVEVHSGTDSGRRRRWTTAEKITIVEESLSQPRMRKHSRHDVGICDGQENFWSECLCKQMQGD